MFKPLTGRISADKYTMQAGAPEAVFEIQVKEVRQNVSSTSDDTLYAVPIEPGIGFGL